MSGGGWCYRMVRLNGMVGIHEAYMDSNGKVRAITEEPVDVLFSEEDDEPVIEAIRRCLGWMALALDKPILDYDKIPEEGAIPFGGDPAEQTIEPMCSECITAMKSDGIPVEELGTAEVAQACGICGQETYRTARW